MASLPDLDPFELWRQALSKFEGKVNSMAASPMNSAQSAQALLQFSGVSRGLQQAFEKALGNHYRRLNLASRQEIGALAEAVQRIEAKLDQLLTAQLPAPGGPRPARTRRPPGAAGTPAAAPAEPAAARPKARRTRKKA